MSQNFVHCIVVSFIFRNIRDVQTRPPTCFGQWVFDPLIYSSLSFTGHLIQPFSLFFRPQGIGVVLPLENKMKNPQAFLPWNGVLNTAMVISCCLYLAVGFFGFLKYGKDCQGSITLNLPANSWMNDVSTMPLLLLLLDVSRCCSCCGLSLVRMFVGIHHTMPLSKLLSFSHGLLKRIDCFESVRTDL